MHGIKFECALRPFGRKQTSTVPISGFDVIIVITVTYNFTCGEVMQLNGWKIPIRVRSSGNIL